MHLINLRVAWEGSDADSDAPPFRVDLPLDWAAFPWPGGNPPARLRLIRRFGAPLRREPGDLPRILLREVDGVTAISLNGSPASWHEESGWHVVEPGALLHRNVLTLHVDTDRAVAASRPWGRLASLEFSQDGLRGPLGDPDAPGIR